MEIKQELALSRSHAQRGNAFPGGSASSYEQVAESGRATLKAFPGGTWERERWNLGTRDEVEPGNER